MTGKTFVYFVTKIRIVFEPAIFPPYFSQIYLLSYQSDSKKRTKTHLPKQTLKNDRKKRTFFLPKDKINSLARERTGKKKRIETTT